MKKILVDSFRKEVKVIKENYDYPNLGHAFVHLAAKLVFDLDDNEAHDFCLIGLGGRDKGIDAFVPEEENKILNIVQGKFTEEKIRKCKRTDIEDLHSAYEWLRNPDPAQRLKRELLRVMNKYREYKKFGYSDKLVLFFFGNIGNDAQSQITLLQNTAGCPVEIFDIERILEMYIEVFEIYKDKGPNVKIDRFFHPVEMKVRGLPRAFICTVPGEEITTLVSKYPFEIFQINVRHYLGRTNPVNKKIEKTLECSTERPFFWYYNLGVNAICDKFDTKKDGLEIKNFRIVNGCQTCNALLNNSNRIKNVRVMLRIIETPDLGLATKIAISNNTQSPIKGRDLFSEDPIQLRLQKEFDKLKPPFFYERKRKEWNSVWEHKRKEALKYKDKKSKRIIDNETAAKGLFSLKLKKPAEAKMRKKDIFVLKDFGGFYENIFNESITPYELLLSYNVYTNVNKKIKEFSKKYKQAIQSNFSGIQKQKEDMEKCIEFLPHSDTQITALFGTIFENRYGDNYDFKKVLDNITPDIFKKIYCWLADQLGLYIENVKTAFGERPFNARNHLVHPGTFNKIENFVNTQLKHNKQILDVLPD